MSCDVLQTESGTDITWLSVSLAMLGKFAFNASFTIIYIYGPEIYPTVVRSVATKLVQELRATLANL